MCPGTRELSGLVIVVHNSGFAILLISFSLEVGEIFLGLPVALPWISMMSAAKSSSVGTTEFIGDVFADTDVGKDFSNDVLAHFCNCILGAVDNDVPDT